MAVSNYIPSKCKYDVRGLENAVYLLASSSLKGIDIDNGEAKITSLSENPIALEAYNVEISDSEELDERYKFSHSVQFSVNGYANELTIGERYYVIVKTKNGEYLLLNALFPCKVEYTYHLGDGVSRTDFNMLTVSNHPTLPIVGYSFPTPHSCGYAYDKIVKLRLNEKRYTYRTDICVCYTNSDGFKEVYFDDGIEFTESYDGDNVTQTLQFSIPLSTYKSSWHYNMLEFNNNKYTAYINTANGSNYVAGCQFGMTPEYDVEGSSSESSINITMTEVSNDSLLSHSKSDNQCLTYDGRKRWVFTAEYNGYECIENGLGMYILKKETDYIGNETGRFAAMVGFQNQFPQLDIVAGFSELEFFNTRMCLGVSGTGYFRLRVTYDGNYLNVLHISPCNTSAILDRDDLIFQQGQYVYRSIQTATIGNCISRIGSRTFDGCGALTGVSISSSVTDIEEAAFANCTSLTSIDIPNNVIHIGDEAFIWCWNLRTVKLSYLINTIGDSTFFGCFSLSSITMPNTIHSIGDMAFENCSSLSSFTIPKYATSVGAYAFAYCSSLTSVTIPSGITYLSPGIFASCTNLPNISIPSGVTEIGEYAFENCSSLTSITIPSGATVINYQTFAGCTNLPSIDIPSGVTNIGWKAFYECVNLTSITIPSGVTEIGKGAFAGCTGLEVIYCNSINPPELVNVLGVSEGAFDNTNNCPIIVPSASVSAYKSAWPRYADRIQGSFVSCTSSKFSATYLGGATYTAPQSSYAEPLTISDTTPEGYARTAMTTATLSDCVTSIAYAFSGCSSLTSVTFPSGLGSIGAYAFDGCSSMSSIDIPNSVTEIGYAAFNDCHSLTSVTIPNSVTYISDYAFGDCDSLSSITIPSGVTSIGTDAFANCSGLTSITIPNSVIGIYGNAFEGCASLTSITIPNSVTSIGGYAFYRCSGLTSVTIGSGITSIGGSAFYYCSNLNSVTCFATTPPAIGTTVFDNTNNCPIYVPSASVDAYKAASRWSDYADRIQAIPNS